VLEVAKIRAGYGRLPVLNDVSLSIPEKTVVGLIGANGAGKSTTVNAIAGVLPISKGEIRFQNQRLDGLRPDQVCKRGISLVPQSRELFPLMSAYENLEIAGITRHGKSQVKDKIEAVLEGFPKLTARLRQRASSLSGGEQQMLAIARALMAEPRLLLLDEPTTGLAPRVIDDLQEIVSNLVQRGQTILLIEQNTRLVMALAHFINVIRKGEIVYSGPASELSGNDELAKFYLQ